MTKNLKKAEKAGEDRKPPQGGAPPEKLRPEPTESEAIVRAMEGPDPLRKRTPVAR